MDPSLITFLFVVLIGSVLIVTMFVLPKRKTKEENGLTPIYETTCSGTYGIFPFYFGTYLTGIRLSIYGHFLVVAIVTPIVIPFSQLARIEVKKSFIGHSLLIQKNGLNLIFHSILKIQQT
jgi:hypothetical protein